MLMDSADPFPGLGYLETVPFPDLSYLETVPFPGRSSLETIPFPDLSYLETVPFPGRSYLETVPFPGLSYLETVPFPGLSTVPFPGLGYYNSKVNCFSASNSAEHDSKVDTARLLQLVLGIAINCEHKDSKMCSVRSCALVGSLAPYRH